jgi:hypothetical protein
MAAGPGSHRPEPEVAPPHTPGSLRTQSVFSVPITRDHLELGLIPALVQEVVEMLADGYPPAPIWPSARDFVETLPPSNGWMDPPGEMPLTASSVEKQGWL